MNYCRTREDYDKRTKAAPDMLNEIIEKLTFDAESFDRDRQIGANREVSRFSAARTRTLPPASRPPAPQLFRARHIVPSRLTHRVLLTPIKAVPLCAQDDS